MNVCERCGEPIYRYCHSEMGPIKAYAWTTVPEDSETDQRYGTRCASISGWTVHVLALEGGHDDGND